jgi:acyl-CoA thioester hydrolase
MSDRLTARANVRVPFYDLDPMGVVWHGRYAQYFEAARCRLLEQIDYDYDAMRRSGFEWPVIDMRIRYVRPARFNQNLEVLATLAEYEHRLKIRYEIRDADSGTRVTKGHTSQVAVRIADGRMLLASPAALVDKVAPLLPGG